MSTFLAIVKEIRTKDSLNIVKFDFNGVLLSMMSLNLGYNLHVGSKVMLGVKPTHIAIGKEFSGAISYANQLQGFVKSIDKGELLSSVNIEVAKSNFESIITTDSLTRISLHVEDKATLFIKASELFIVEIYND